LVYLGRETQNWVKGELQNRGRGRVLPLFQKGRKVLVSTEATVRESAVERDHDILERNCRQVSRGRRTSSQTSKGARGVTVQDKRGRLNPKMGRGGVGSKGATGGDLRLNSSVDLVRRAKRGLTCSRRGVHAFQQTGQLGRHGSSGGQQT